MPPIELMTDSQTKVVRIPPDRRLEAAERLVAASGAGADGARRFLEAARTHGIDLNNLWGDISSPRGKIGEVCLLTPGAGRTAMAFTSTPETTMDQHRLAAVLERACGEIQGVVLAQALLEPQEKSIEAAYLQARFLSLGSLLYLSRPWDDALVPVEEDTWPPGVSIEPYGEHLKNDLIAALEASYVDTLDCPELCGMRTTRDVLASHLATGAFDPTLWWLLRVDGSPAGALLLNESPPLKHTELVYLGLAPIARGRGLASRLLTIGLDALRKRPHRQLTCAVDARNTPARALYKRFGFVETTQRHALVRPITPEPA